MLDRQITLQADINDHKTDNKGNYIRNNSKKFIASANLTWEKYFTTNNILSGINKRSLKTINSKFDDLYSLTSREDFILQAIINLKGNKGSSTSGVDVKSLDGISDIDILSLSNKIKNKTFRFQPVKRVLVPKPGKTEKRPLGIPTFEDRIVQEMIRMILEVIYEPIFEYKHHNANFGFRPGKSSKDALEKIKRKAQNTEWCIEGDVKKAFDWVDHDKLINILSEKIVDSSFLKLISQGLKCGCINKGHYEHTILGTPQGGIASPILFNIYFSKMDEFILENIASKIENWNRMESRTPKPVTKSYRKHESETSSVKRSLTRIKSSLKQSNIKEFKHYPSAIQEKYLNLVSRLRKSKKASMKTPYLDKKRALIRFAYARYADDWVFFSNCSQKRIMEIKQDIADFLQDELKATLSEEKTLITNIKRKRAKFLGFSLSYYATNTKVLRITNISKEKHRFKKNFWEIKANTHKKESHTRRTTGNQLVIGIDQDRVESRLITKKILLKDGITPCRKPELTVLSDSEIVMRYNYIIRGFVNYYGPVINNFSILNKYIYIFYYSCAHTLANKHNTSLKKLFKKKNTVTL
nr:hypothetical protein [Borodinellopsis texensis]